jgi:hypothetical protein
VDPQKAQYAGSDSEKCRGMRGIWLEKWGKAQVAFSVVVFWRGEADACAGGRVTHCCCETGKRGKHLAWGFIVRLSADVSE